MLFQKHAAIWDLTFSRNSISQLLPLDDDFSTRAKAIEWRAQEHLLDEVLHALYEHEDLQKQEHQLSDKQLALIYIMLWTCVEALDSRWRP